MSKKEDQSGMNVKLWGVRGSIPAPLGPEDYQSRLLRALAIARDAWEQNPDLEPESLLEKMPEHLHTIVGGETTCVEVRSGDVQLILDMGTGARRLGYDILGRGYKGPLHVLMTHTHWDHIQGWPFFVPGYIPDYEVHFYSCMDDCENRFIGQQIEYYFPVTFDSMGSGRKFHQVKPGDSFEIGPFNIRTEDLQHPGGSTSYRIECDGRSFVFATDTEFFGPGLADQIESKRSFFEGADLLVMDAQYTPEEAEQKKGWGHTSMQTAVECALKWKVKQLVFTHHEPAHTDDATYKIFDDARKFLKDNNPNGHVLELAVAREGDSYSL